MQNSAFVTLIKRVHIDEAHFIYTAGIDNYGLAAFRRAWSRLTEFRIRLSKHTSFQALSGTQPPHIKRIIKEHLLFTPEKLCSVELSSNRPNIAYATHPIVGELSNFRNLDFLVPQDCALGSIQIPKTIVFHDDSDEASSAAIYLDHRLSLSLQNKGIVQHYHGGMSKEYLTKVYKDFRKPDGTCQILHATKGASTAQFFLRT